MSYRHYIYKKIQIIIFLLAGLHVSHAATLQYSDTITFTPTDWSDQFTIPQFDPALGTLNSVVVSLDGNMTFDLQLECVTEYPSANPCGATVQTVYALQNPSSSALLNTTVTQNFSIGGNYWDGVLDYAGSSGATYVDYNSNGTNSVTLTSDLSSYSGSGNALFAIDANNSYNAYSSDGTLHNIFSNHSAAATLSVTYNYGTADLSLSKDVNQSSVQAGKLFTYTLTLNNAGPFAADEVSVTDLLSDEHTFHSYRSDQGDYNDTTGVWDVGTIDTNTSLTLDILASLEFNICEPLITEAQCNTEPSACFWLIDECVPVPDSGASSAEGVVKNTAQVTYVATTADPDSTPNNDDGNQSEDDEAFVYVSVDNTSPSSPTLELDAASDSGAHDDDNITSQNTVLLTGSAEANSTVDIYNGATELNTTSADTSGNWSVPVTLPAGSYNLTATSTDLAGNISSSSSTLAIDIDTTAPAGYSVAFDDDLITGAERGTSTFTFTNAEVGAMYTYIVFRADLQVTGSGIISEANATVNIDDLSNIGQGIVDLNVTLTDTAGNIGNVATDRTRLIKEWYDITRIDMNTQENTDNNATFDVMLYSEPTDTVTITLSSENLNEGIIALPISNTLTFTTSDWNQTQSVVVTPVDDSVYEPCNRAYGIKLESSSNDSNYHAIIKTLRVLNIDDDGDFGCVPINWFILN